jgi:pilus assembly protein CpaE
MRKGNKTLMDRITVLIASENPEYRKELADSLSREKDIKIIGQAINGAGALRKTEQLLPDIIVIEAQMAVVDGITATEKITLAHPDVGVVIIGTESGSEFIKKAMMAGARDYLLKDQMKTSELVEAVRRINHTEKTRTASFASIRKEDKQQKLKVPQVVTVFGAKGGAGKTTLSVNIAVEIARETKMKVALIDLDLQFGDVAVYLNIQPRRTIAELVQERNDWDIQLLNNYLITHSSGIKILAAPARPEDADLIVPEQVEKILTILRQNFDYIVVDSPPFFSDTLLTALDMSNQIVLIMPMDLPSVKNLKLSLNLLDNLHHSGKTKLVINRASNQFGIEIRDVEQTIDFMVAEEIPSDGPTVVGAANKGMPFVLSHPQTDVSKAVMRVVHMILNDYGYQKDLAEKKGKRSLWERLFR